MSPLHFILAFHPSGLAQPWLCHVAHLSPHSRSLFPSHPTSQAQRSPYSDAELVESLPVHEYQSITSRLKRGSDIQRDSLIVLLLYSTEIRNQWQWAPLACKEISKKPLLIATPLVEHCSCKAYCGRPTATGKRAPRGVNQRSPRTLARKIFECQ